MFVAETPKRFKITEFRFKLFSYTQLPYIQFAFEV